MSEPLCGHEVNGSIVVSVDVHEEVVAVVEYLEDLVAELARHSSDGGLARIVASDIYPLVADEEVLGHGYSQFNRRREEGFPAFCSLRGR